MVATLDIDVCYISMYTKELNLECLQNFPLRYNSYLQYLLNQYLYIISYLSIFIYQLIFNERSVELLSKWHCSTGLHLGFGVTVASGMNFLLIGFHNYFFVRPYKAV